MLGTLIVSIRMRRCLHIRLHELVQGGQESCLLRHSCDSKTTQHRSDCVQGRVEDLLNTDETTFHHVRRCGPSVFLRASRDSLALSVKPYAATVMPAWQGCRFADRKMRIQSTMSRPRDQGRMFSLNILQMNTGGGTKPRQHAGHLIKS